MKQWMLSKGQTGSYGNHCDKRARACPVPLHHRRARSKVMEEKEGLKEFQSFLGKGLEVGGGGGCRSAQCSHDRLV